MRPNHLPMRWLGRLALCGLTIAGVSCVTVRAPSFMRSPAERSWPATLSAAQHAAAAGQFGAADSLLVGFAHSHPGSPEAMETNYWRALYALDPANTGAKLEVATDELSTYLAASGPRQHVAEATSLSRVAGALNSLTKESALAMSRARSATAADGSSSEHASEARPAERADTAAANSDAEVRHLRDELAKANAELDRIRKRLTNAGKPPR